MKLLSFGKNGVATYGICEGDKVADLGALTGAPVDLKAFLAVSEGDRQALVDRVTFDLNLETINFLPVIPNPGKILCVGLNYEEHRLETGRPKAQYPAIFTRFADSQTGHETNILTTDNATRLDYEGELAIVIGKPGSKILKEDAFSHIAGYSCYNDGSYREWQEHTHQFTPGKNFPRTGAFGPFLVTPDEVGELPNLKIQTRLNGQVMQSATFSQMIFPVADIIAYVSGFTPLSPGDVIATGTPGGVGNKRDPKIVMKAGDVVEVEIDRVGLLRNGVGAE